MKRLLRSGIRRLHLLALKRALPQRIGIYFHAVEAGGQEDLRECLSYWREQDYRFVDAAALCETSSERRIFLSFDDNYRSWMDLLPLLDDAGVEATFFVNTLPLRDTAGPEVVRAYFDRIRHAGECVSLSRGEVSEIVAAGHSIGCHTHSHLVLRDLPPGRWKSEIDDARDILAEASGRPVVDFSYPFGMRRHFNERLRRYCLERGFRTVCNAIPGMQYARQRLDSIQRTAWDLSRPLADNVDNLRIDARLFTGLTGRSAGI